MAKREKAGPKAPREDWKARARRAEGNLELAAATIRLGEEQERAHLAGLEALRSEIRELATQNVRLKDDLRVRLEVERKQRDLLGRVELDMAHTEALAAILAVLLLFRKSDPAALVEVYEIGRQMGYTPDQLRKPVGRAFGIAGSKIQRDLLSSERPDKPMRDRLVQEMVGNGFSPDEAMAAVAALPAGMRPNRIVMVHRQK